MGDWIQYIIAIGALTLLVGGWGAVQLLAKRMNVKNHIDHNGSCCGACENRVVCDKTD